MQNLSIFWAPVLGLGLWFAGCGISQTKPVQIFSIDTDDLKVVAKIFEDGRCEALVFGHAGWACRVEGDEK